MRINNRRWKRISFGNAAVLLMSAALISQVLGFFRTKLVNANFGDLPVGDPQNAGVYFAAFVLPDFFFFVIAAGALGVAFMPYLNDRLAKSDKKGVWDLSTSLLNFLSIFLFGVGLVMFVFADVLASRLTHGYTPEQLHNVALMMRILSLNPMLFTISGVIAAVQQVFGRFFFYAIAPIFYNVSIIASLYAFKDNIGIVGLAIGAAIGAVLQLLIIVVGVYGLGFHWKPQIKKTDDFRSMLKQLPPRSLDQGLDQVQNIVETNLASNAALGGATAVANYNTAYVLHAAPILLIGTAISTAVFPKLNARLSHGRYDLFRQDFLRTLRLIIWIVMPVVVICFFARGYLARLIFSRTSSGPIAIIFGALCVAILFRTIFAIISRWFYAQKDTHTPLFVSIFVIALNVILAYSLSRPNSYGVVGLAIAQSIVATVEVVILGAIMLSRDRQLFDAEFWGGIVKIVSVTGFSLIAGFISVQLWPLMTADKGMTLLLKLSAIAGVTGGTHLLVSALFGLSEATALFGAVKKFVLKPVRMEY